MLVFFQTVEFWPCFYTHCTFDQYYSYKHLPFTLSFQCNNWNSWFEFCPYFYTRWNFDVILPDTAILALSVYTLKFLSYRSKHCNSGPIFVTQWNLHGPDPLKHWTSSLIFINIGILSISFETLEFWPFFLQTFELLSNPSTNWNFWPYFFTDWNFHLILPNIWILALFLKTLEFLSYPSIANIEILALSFQTMEFWPIIYAHWFLELILQNTGILALFL